MRTRLDKALVSLTAPESFAAEQYQSLRLTIERLRSTRSVQILGITSPGVGDGKTLTSINLAAAHGAGDRVLLIDADLRRRTIGRYLHLEDAEAPGLADALMTPGVELAHIVRHSDRLNFAVALAGSPSAAVHELLRSPRLDRLLQDARRQFDLVVMDTAPLVPTTDSAVLARAVDAMLIVVAANDTPRKLLEESLNLLDPSKVLGIVFNRDRRPSYGRYDHYMRGSRSVA